MSELEDFWSQDSVPVSLIYLGRKYLNWLYVQEYRENTLEGKKRTLKYFIEWCEERNIVNVSNVTRSLIEKYELHLYERPSENTGKPLTALYRMANLHTVSGFFRWLAQENYLLHNPAAVIVRPKIPKRIPRHVFSYQQVLKIFEQADLSDPAGIRDRAIMETFYSTGIRRRELLRLKQSDINFQYGTVMVWQGKNGKDRVVPIGDNALYWIEKYQNEARPLLKSDQEDQTLFISQHGTPFAQCTLTQRIKRYIKKAGFDPRGACHLFRHAMATHMMENGADVRYIQEMLGHSCLSSTEIYTKVSIRKLQEVHDRTHPAKMYPTKTQEILAVLTKPKPPQA